MSRIKTKRFFRGVLFRGQRIVNWLRNKMLYARDARLLTRQLFADISQLDEREVLAAKEKILNLCHLQGYDREMLENWETHVYRVILTEKWIADAIARLPKAVRALDLGVEGITSQYWRWKFSNVEWENTDFDLRFPWKVPPALYDFVVCTELVEHLSDPPNEIFNEGFYKLGFSALLSEAFKALKPGGYMLITTPNASSVLHLKAVLQGDPPWFFIKHVREYTLSEVTGLLHWAGFEIIQKRDIHCMSAMAFSDYSPIFQLLLENGFPTEGRGDDLFILARKPMV